MAFTDFLDDLLDYSPVGWANSAIEAGFDSLGLSQHGRDQYVNQENQRELMANQNEYNQQNFWTQFNAQNSEFDRRYNAYESPTARVQALKSAGINPAAVLGNGSGGFGSVSSAANPSSVSVPALSPSAPGQVSSKGTSDYIDALSRLKLSEAQSEEIFSLLKGKVENQEYENQIAQQMLFLRKFENKMNELYGSRERAQKLNNLVFEGIRAQMQGDESAAAKKFLDAKTILANDEHLKNKEELPYVGLMLDAMVQMWKKQGSYYGAAADYQSAMATTENKLRDLHYDILSYEKEIQQNEANISTETQWSRINEIKKKAEAANYLPENAKVALEMAEKENNLYYAKQIIGMCSEAVATVMSIRTGGRIASAMEVRNEIQQRMFEYQKENGVTESVRNTYDKKGNLTGRVHTYGRKRPIRKK